VKLQAGHIHALVVGSSAMVDIFFLRRLYRLESFDTLFDDNPEPSAARAISNKLGMARKRICAPAVCVATKTRCNAQVRKRHHLKKNVPTYSFAYLRTCLRAKKITALASYKRLHTELQNLGKLPGYLPE